MPANMGEVLRKLGWLCPSSERCVMRLPEGSSEPEDGVNRPALRCSRELAVRRANRRSSRWSLAMYICLSLSGMLRLRAPPPDDAVPGLEPAVPGLEPAWELGLEPAAPGEFARRPNERMAWSRRTRIPSRTGMVPKQMDRGVCRRATCASSAPAAHQHSERNCDGRGQTTRGWMDPPLCAGSLSNGPTPIGRYTRQGSNHKREGRRSKQRRGRTVHTNT